MSRFSGRRAVVTGGADGIGLALAQRLTAEGAQVAVLDIRAEQARAAAATLPGSVAIAADISDRADLQRAAEEVAAHLGGLDLLWINAGVGSAARIAEAGERTLTWVLGVNVSGPILTAQAFLPLLRASPGARSIGVTASTAALTTPTGTSLYAATKHMTVAVAEGLRSNLAAEDIGVTIFCPGLLNTNIWDAGKALPERLGGPVYADPAGAGRWRSAESPGAAVARALAVMAAGGGYAVHLTDEETRTAFEARTAAIRAAIDLG